MTTRTKETTKGKSFAYKAFVDGLLDPEIKYNFEKDNFCLSLLNAKYDPSIKIDSWNELKEKSDYIIPTSENYAPNSLGITFVFGSKAEVPNAKFMSVRTRETMKPSITIQSMDTFDEALGWAVIYRDQIYSDGKYVDDSEKKLLFCFYLGGKTKCSKDTLTINFGDYNIAVASNNLV